MTNAHASKTDTFIIGNSLRVHSSRLPNMERLPRNGAGANQSNENSTRCTHLLCLNLPRNGRIPTNQMRAVHAHAYALPPKFYCRIVEKAPLICKQPEAYTCGVQRGNMAEVKKAAALFTQLFSVWSKFFVVYYSYPMT